MYKFKFEEKQLTQKLWITIEDEIKETGGPSNICQILVGQILIFPEITNSFQVRKSPRTMLSMLGNVSARVLTANFALIDKSLIIESLFRWKAFSEKLLNFQLQHAFKLNDNSNIQFFQKNHQIFSNCVGFTRVSKVKQAGTAPRRRHIQGSKIAKGLPSVNLQYSKIETPKKWTEWRAGAR